MQLPRLTTPQPAVTFGAKSAKAKEAEKLQKLRAKEVDLNLGPTNPLAQFLYEAGWNKEYIPMPKHPAPKAKPTTSPDPLLGEVRPLTEFLDEAGWDNTP